MPRLALTGDVMLGRKVGEAIRRRGPAHVFGDAAEVFGRADATLANLECVVAGAETGVPEPGRTFHFRAPPAAVEALEHVGVRVATLANNHALDFGGEALVETLARLEEAGIETAGAAETPGRAWDPAEVSVDGLDVGVLATTDNVPAWSVEKRRPGVAHAPADPSAGAFEELAREVEALARDVDVAIVSAHWGPNMVREPSQARREAARRLVEAGADVVWGHSAHLFQAVERLEGGLVVHDAGDTVDDYRIDPDEHNEATFAFLLEATPRSVGPLELVPLEIDPRERQVNRASPGAAQFARGRMRELCEAVGTPLEETGEGGLRVPAVPPG